MDVHPAPYLKTISDVPIMLITYREIMEYPVIIILAIAVVAIGILLGTGHTKRHHAKKQTSKRSNFCFVSDNDLASYRLQPKEECCCMSSGRDPGQEFIDSTSPQFQLRGIPFPDLKPLPPANGWRQEYLYPFTLNSSCVGCGIY
jgi:hypothetical protein